MSGNSLPGVSSKIHSYLLPLYHDVSPSIYVFASSWGGVAAASIVATSAFSWSFLCLIPNNIAKVSTDFKSKPWSGPPPKKHTPAQYFKSSGGLNSPPAAIILSLNFSIPPGCGGKYKEYVPAAGSPLANRSNIFSMSAANTIASSIFESRKSIIGSNSFLAVLTDDCILLTSASALSNTCDKPGNISSIL